MAWLISQALMSDCENSHCLPVLAAESSADTSLAGERSVLSSKTPMPHAYLCSDKTKGFSRLSRSGMTFGHLTESRGEAVLTWCLAASRAKTFRQLGEAPESMASGLGSGARWRELFQRFDRDSFSWRTHRCLFDEVCPESSVTLPRWGMIVAGVLWERLTPGLPTSDTGSGLWPTPKASAGGPDFSKMNGRDNRPMGPSLSLPTMVALWPTPCASEGRDCGTNWQSLAAMDKHGRIARRMATRGGPETQQTQSAQLNPNWVEWLMGWPIGWTALGRLEMVKFQQWRQWHGGS